MDPRLLLLPLLLLAPLAHAAPPALAPLLARLAASDAAREAREGTVPVVVTKRAEKLDRKGRVTARRERVTRHVGRGDDEAVELLRQVEDGKDVTAERRAELARERAKQGPARKSGASALRLPFAAELQPRYRYALGAGPADAPGLARVRFTPVEPSPELLAGEALVDVASGEAVALDATQSKLPAMADFVKLRFELDGPPGARELVRVHSEAAGGVLFVRQHVRAVTTYAYERDGRAASSP